LIEYVDETILKGLACILQVQLGKSDSASGYALRKSICVKTIIKNKNIMTHFHILVRIFNLVCAFVELVNLWVQFLNY
jgi:hypothetical protein